MNNADFDRTHLWHPYTSMTSPLPCYEVVAADGVRLELANGCKIIDGMSSWWCAIHGYNNKELNAALVEQTQKMAHVMFGGITHPPAVRLGRLLVDMTHPDLQCVFFCDSGSVAVEVALKQALQYCAAKGQAEKKRFLSLARGYHGDTFGAMFVSDRKSSMHSMYGDYGPQNFFAAAPEVEFGQGSDNLDTDDSDIQADTRDFRRIIETHHTEIAAVILEPILQGAGGMRTYHPKYLREVRRLCSFYDVLLILDEIATGFGRTGKLFAYEHAQICPDILCLGKALTGGYMTMAAVVLTREVAEVISEGPAGCFMHGPTFMANPLACAVSVRNLEMLQGGEWQEQVAGIEKVLWRKLAPLRKLRGVKAVRVLGAVGVVEMVERVDLAAIQRKFVARGVWVRPFGALVYVMPPFVISPEDLEFLVDAVVEVVREEASALRPEKRDRGVTIELGE